MTDFLSYNFDTTFLGITERFILKPELRNEKKAKIRGSLTTNACEVWNRALNNIFDRHKPSLMTFLVGIVFLEILNWEMIDKNILLILNVGFTVKNSFNNRCD